MNVDQDVLLLFSASLPFISTTYHAIILVLLEHISTYYAPNNPIGISIDFNTVNHPYK